MTVLVTGGTGFLGSHVVEELSRRGRPVRALVRRNSNTLFLKTLPGVELSEGAVDDTNSLRAALEGVDQVVHAAGLVKAKSPDEFRAINTQGTENLLDAALAHGVRRFVLVSSLAAVGPSDAEGRPVPLDAAPRPVTHYGRSKLLSEEALLRRKHELDVIVLRPAAIYGPRDREIFAFFKSVALGVLPMTNPPQAKLSMIYGPDCASACVRALDADVPSGTRLSLDDGSVHTFAELIQAVERAIGKRAWLRLPLPKRAVLGIAGLTELYGKVTNRAVMLTRDKCNELFDQWVCDGSHAQKALDWAPAVAFEEGVERTVAWYRKMGWL